MLEPTNRLTAALAGRYDIERELGHGGMATVYLARDLKHGRKVALKVLNPDLAAGLGVERFLREIRVAAQLHHPHILPLYDSGDADGWFFYVMPHIEGETLRARLERERQLPVDEAVSIALDLASALSYAHSYGVIHRDIKPENILFSAGKVLLADFGIARVVSGDEGPSLTATGWSVGTPAYMSPEQAGGDRRLDARSDVYALGCMLYEMLAGDPPFSGSNAQAILARKSTEDAWGLRTVRSSVPPALEAAILKALARTPADRWATAAAFGDALRNAGSSAPARRLGRDLRAAGALAVLAAALGTGYALWAFGRSGGAHHPAAGPVPQGTSDAGAYELYTRGRNLIARRTAPQLGEAVTLFQLAIARDSGFARAWAGLARALDFAAVWQFAIPGIPGDSLLTHEVAAMERALALDSTSAEIWLAEARVAQRVDPTSRTTTLAALRRALAIDSLNPTAWQQLGVALEETGDPAGAEAALRRASAVRPDLSEAMAWMGLHFYWHRQYDSSRVWAERAVEQDPTYVLGRTALGDALIALNRLDDAEAAFAASRRLATGPEIVGTVGLARVALARRDRTQALALVQEALARTDRAAPAVHSAVALAVAYTALGDREAALEWLRHFRPTRDLHFQLHLRLEPPFDPLRADPRFRALVEPGR